VVTSAKEIRVFFTNFEVLFYSFFVFFLVTHITFYHGIHFIFLRDKLPALVLNTVRTNLFCGTVRREVLWP